MAGRVKFNINGKGVDPASGGRYSGPDLPKGSYTARVKRMEMMKIKSIGENKGKPRIRILLEVVSGAGAKSAVDTKYEYFGCPVWDGLNIIENSIPFVNAFLHGLTDGSDGQKRAIEAAFWDDGPVVKTVANPNSGAKEQHIIRIGNFKIASPDGQHLVQITTKAGKNNQTGEYQPQITGYQPYLGEDRPKTGSTEDEDVDDMLGGEDEGEPDDDAEDDDEPDYDDDEDDEEDDESDDLEEDESDDVDAETDAKETATAGSRKKPPF